MPAFVTILIVAVVLTVAFAVFYAHLRFQRTQAYQWREQVRARVAELVSEADELQHPPSGGSADRWRAELFRQHLRTLPLTALLPCTGIGPGTVDRLSAARLQSIADLTQFDVSRIHGFGPAKSADVRMAVRQVVREAEGRFEAGACPEGQEFSRRLATQAATEQAEAEGRRLKIQAVNAVLARLSALEALANQVTFLNHLLKRMPVGLTDDVMARPLPELQVPSVPPPAPIPIARPEPPPVPTHVVMSARPAASAVSSGDLFRVALAAPVRAADSPTTEPPHLHRLRVFARFGFVVAKADGRIAKAERAAIRSFLSDLFGHDPVLVRHIDPTIEQVEAAVPSEEVVVREVLAVVTNPVDRQAVYAAAERIAEASGERNQREEEMLGRLRAVLGVAADPTPVPVLPRGNAECVSPTPGVASRQTESPSSPDPRTILEIDPPVELSADLIRRRYTLLTEKADPAKAATLGPEFERMAVKKRADLRQAAESLIARFGVPLDPPAAPPPSMDLRHNPDLDDVFGG